MRMLAISTAIPSPSIADVTATSDRPLFDLIDQAVAADRGLKEIHRAIESAWDRYEEPKKPLELDWDSTLLSCFGTKGAEIDERTGRRTFSSDHVRSIRFDLEGTLKVMPDGKSIPVWWGSREKRERMTRVVEAYDAWLAEGRRIQGELGIDRLEQDEHGAAELLSRLITQIRNTRAETLSGLRAKAEAIRTLCWSGDCEPDAEDTRLMLSIVEDLLH